MLGKLFKYEIKATARLFMPLYLTILVFAVINRFFIPMYNLDEKSPTLYNMASTISVFIYAALLAGLVLMTLIVMIQRFYKNLLGDEGYLMFTLPVQTWMHILSKLIISMLWTIISGFVALCSILLISSNNIAAPEILKALSAAFDQFRRYFGASTFIVSFEIIVLGLLSLASAILTIYAAIALGHLFSKYKLLISFGMYIVLRTVSQMLIMLFAFIFTDRAEFRIGNNLVPNVLQINSFLLLSIFYFGAITIGYFILSNYILKKKLNLE